MGGTGWVIECGMGGKGWCLLGYLGGFGFVEMRTLRDDVLVLLGQFLLWDIVRFRVMLCFKGPYRSSCWIYLGT